MILTHHPDIPDRDTGLKFLGYWYRPEYPLRMGARVAPHKATLDLPKPQDYVDTKWSRREQMIVVAYLKNGQPWEQWMGPSWCRFGCEFEDDAEKVIGCEDLSDGVYVWPEGLAHYVAKHDVRPAQEFLDHVFRR